MASGVIFDLRRYATRGGGWQTAVHFKGCPLRCLWCSNPESQRFEPEIMVRSDRCLGCGRCEEVCPTGAALTSESPRTVIDRDACKSCGTCVGACPLGNRELRGRLASVEEIIHQIDPDDNAQRRSTVVSLTGGEPALQPAFAAELLRACRRRGIRTALETCGHVPWLDLSRVLSHADVVVFDLKHVDPHTHRRLTGVSNELILRNLERTVEFGATVIVRLPLVPGCNADSETVRAVAELARRLGVAELHLVPYHRQGEWKYGALGRGYPLDGAIPLSEEVVAELKRNCEQVPGLKVRVCG